MNSLSDLRTTGKADLSNVIRPASPLEGMNRADGEFIKWLSEIDLSDVASVGGRNAWLGEIYLCRRNHGVNVPNGFVLTTEAYRYFLRESGIAQKIQGLLMAIDTTDVENLRSCAMSIRHLITEAHFPEDLEQAIARAYELVRCGDPDPVDVVVRGSSLGEGWHDPSLVGEPQTYLNVRGLPQLLEACRACFASLFNERAVFYRTFSGDSRENIAISVGVQRMVRSDLGASGVMSSLGSGSSFPDTILIKAAYGLDLGVLHQGTTPDEYYVLKPVQKAGAGVVVRKIFGTKLHKVICRDGPGKTVEVVPVSVAERSHFALYDDEALTLARWAGVIENRYVARTGRTDPLTIHWAKDGLTGELFIVELRPEIQPAGPGANP